MTEKQLDLRLLALMRESKDVAALIEPEAKISNVIQFQLPTPKPELREVWRLAGHLAKAIETYLGTRSGELRPGDP